MPAPAARRLLAAPALALLAGGCTLAEVSLPPSDDVLVVEAILRTDYSQQRILLHRAVQNGAARGEPGATITVTGSDGVRLTFREAQGDEEIARCLRVDERYLETGENVTVGATCYVSNPLVPAVPLTVRPGLTYDLEILTAGGERVLGRTTLPAAFTVVNVPTTGASQPTVSSRCNVLAGTTLPITWRRSRGAWSYLSDLRIFGLRGSIPDAPDPLELRGLAISETDTSIVLPTEYGVFDRFDLDQELLRQIQDGFPAGVSVQLTVAAADRNLVNGIRGGQFNPSGQVRVSSVTGDAVGVFGSMVVRRAIIEVNATARNPLCGGAATASVAPAG